MIRLLDQRKWRFKVNQKPGNKGKKRRRDEPPPFEKLTDFKMN